MQVWLSTPSFPRLVSKSVFWCMEQCFNHLKKTFYFCWGQICHAFPTFSCRFFCITSKLLNMLHYQQRQDISCHKCNQSSRWNPQFGRTYVPNRSEATWDSSSVGWYKTMGQKIDSFSHEPRLFFHFRIILVVLIGILIMVSLQSQHNGVVWCPVHPEQPGFFHCWLDLENCSWCRCWALHEPTIFSHHPYLGYSNCLKLSPLSKICHKKRWIDPRTQFQLFCGISLEIQNFRLG